MKQNELTLSTFLSKYVGHYENLNIRNEDTDTALTEDEIFRELYSSGEYGDYLVSEIDVMPVPCTSASFWIYIEIRKAEETK